MKHRILIALIACCSLAVAQPIFQKQYVGLSCYSGIAITNDGGYMLSGTDRYSGAGNMCVVKTDLKGTIRWATSFGDGGVRDSCMRMIKTKDGGFLLGGMYNVAAPKLYLVKLNPYGTRIWTKYYEVLAANNNNQTISDMVELSDSSVVIAGNTGGNLYGMFMKVDKNGNILFAKNHNQNYIIINKVLPIAGGEFLVTGSNTGGSGVFYAARLDAAGTAIWAKTFTSMGTGGHSIIRTSDGNYVWQSSSTLSGYTSLMKTDVSGNIIWAQQYTTTGNMNGCSVKELPTNELLVTGWSTNGFGAIFMKVSSTGAFINARSLPALPNVGSKDILATPDGSYATTFGTYLVKFNSGISVCGSNAATVNNASVTPVATNQTLTYNGFAQQITRTDFTFQLPVTAATICGGRCTTADNMSMSFNMADTVCQGDQVSISNVSAGSTSTTWYENNVQFFSGASPFPRTYNTPGAYNIMLTGFNGSCKDTTTKTLYVKSDCGTNGTAVNVFQRSYTNFTNGSDIRVTKDKGYVLAGSSTFSGNADMCMLKLDSAGGVQWAKYFGSNSVVEYGSQVRQTMDGGYIIAGYNNTSPRYMFVVRTDGSGNVIWENNYQMLNGTNTYQSPNDILLTSDSGFVITGSSNTINYALMFKIDKTGTVVWGNNFNGSGNQAATVNSICNSYTGGGFMITGTVNSTMYVAQLNSFGTVIWAKTYTSAFLQAGQKIIQTNDGNFLVGCYQSSTQGTPYMKIDPSGNIIWTRLYYGLGTMTVHGIREDKDRGFVITGHGTGATGITVIKVDKVGNLKDAKYFFGTNGYGDFHTYDQGYVILDNNNNVRKFTAFNQINACSVNSTTPSVISIGLINTGTGNFVPNAYAQTNNQFYLTGSSTHAASNVCASTGCNLKASMLFPTIGCAGTTYNLTNTSMGGTTYTWKENNVTFSSSYNTTRVFSAAGTYTIKLVINGPNGCADSISQNIVISSPVTANAGNNITIACGSNTVLTGSGGTTYTWAPITALSNAYISNPTATPSTTTTYTLTAATGGCSSTAAVTVTIVGTPTVTATGGTTICQGQSANLSCSGSASTYTWMPGGQTGTGITVTPGATTTYTVMGYTSGNCFGSAVVTVNVNPLPNPVITQIGNYLQSTAAVTYQWYLNGGLLSGAVNQNYTFTQNGNYTVRVTDANGCSNTSVIYVVTTTGIDNQPGAAILNIVPNPNNGLFAIYVQTEGMEEARISLHNMLGEEVELIEQGAINGLYKKEIDAQYLRSGVYFLSYRSAAGTITRKFIKN